VWLEVRLVVRLELGLELGLVRLDLELARLELVLVRLGLGPERRARRLPARCDRLLATPPVRRRRASSNFRVTNSAWRSLSEGSCKRASL
jgi:hypothetical protein